MKRKAQSAIEFVIIVAAVLFGSVLLLFVFQQKFYEKMREEQNLAVREIALKVQKEISLAVKARDGYERTFYLPLKALNKEYSIVLTDNLVFINTTGDGEAVSFSVQNVSGFIQKGQNVIRKDAGRIYINE